MLVMKRETKQTAFSLFAGFFMLGLVEPVIEWMTWSPPTELFARFPPCDEKFFYFFPQQPQDTLLPFDSRGKADQPAAQWSLEVIPNSLNECWPTSRSMQLRSYSQPHCRADQAEDPIQPRLADHRVVQLDPPTHQKKKYIFFWSFFSRVLFYIFCQKKTRLLIRHWAIECTFKKGYFDDDEGFYFFLAIFHAPSPGFPSYRSHFLSIIIIIWFLQVRYRAKETGSLFMMMHSI